MKLYLLKNKTMEQNSIREASPKLSFTDAVRQVFNKYATFKGRARRSEYWWFVLFYSLVLIAAAILDNLLASPLSTPFTERFIVLRHSYCSYPI